MGAAPVYGQTAGAASQGWPAVARRPLPRRRGCCKRSIDDRPQEGSLRAEAPPARAAACKGDRQQRQRL
ncbi:hypothetical protein GW17_00043523 [Ensete ventricosum]|nr:hypothetical protein GW17_00043523 [Ensete ventricosum]